MISLATGLRIGAIALCRVADLDLDPEPIIGARDNGPTLRLPAEDGQKFTAQARREGSDLVLPLSPKCITEHWALQTARVVLSYLKWQVRPHPREESFEKWVINRFGGRPYRHFFRSYTQKVWGVPPAQIQAEWAAQRIKNLSLYKALWNAFTGANDTASLIETFRYPRLGPGMMRERMSELVSAAGGEVRMRSTIEAIRRDGLRVVDLEVLELHETGPVRYSPPAEQFVSSMALRDAILRFDPPPPEEVRLAAERLRYRDFLIVTLVLDQRDPFPDNWIYIHSPQVKVGRIQNFRAWSPEMTPNDRQSSIGMEYFCREGDDLWSAEDGELIELASKELAVLGLASADAVVDGTVIRQPTAYPVCNGEYKAALATISAWMGTLENFQTIGRNGLHRYNIKTTPCSRQCSRRAT